MGNEGQVWIETVLYTLIGLALIGIALAIITPKITEMKDKMIVEQSIQLLNAMDGKIWKVSDGGVGNRLVAEFIIKKGEIHINPGEDKIIFILKELKKPYSEPGVLINMNGVEVLSGEGQKESNVSLTLDYGGVLNITYDGGVDTKKFNAVSVPYKFYIENLGENKIDIKEASVG